jgi:hypothetical protein
MPLAPLAIRDGNNAAANQEMLQGGSGPGNNIPVMSLDSTRVTYRASANFTPTATAAVTMITVTGSATRTVRIKRILIGGVSTAVSQSIFILQRTSALGAGGTAVAPTIALLDRGAAAAYAAATAVVNHYTTTLKATGTVVGGPISTWNQQTGVVTTPATLGLGFLQPVFPENGAGGSAIVLRGATDYLEVQNSTPANLGAGTVLCYVVEFEEDLS